MSACSDLAAGQSLKKDDEIEQLRAKVVELLRLMVSAEQDRAKLAEDIAAAKHSSLMWEQDCRAICKELCVDVTVESVDNIADQAIERIQAKNEALRMMRRWIALDNHDDSENARLTLQTVSEHVDAAMAKGGGK